MLGSPHKPLHRGFVRMFTSCLKWNTITSWNNVKVVGLKIWKGKSWEGSRKRWNERNISDQVTVRVVWHLVLPVRWHTAIFTFCVLVLAPVYTLRALTLAHADDHLTDRCTLTEAVSKAWFVSTSLFGCGHGRIVTVRQMRAQENGQWCKVWTAVNLDWWEDWGDIMLEIKFGLTLLFFWEVLLSLAAH